MEDFDKNDPFADEPEDSEPEDDDFPSSEAEDELPSLMVWVNAGFGSRSYECYIKSDSTMVIPDPLVRELDLHPGDELEYDYDDEDKILYISKKEIPWESPEWMQD